MYSLLKFSRADHLVNLPGRMQRYIHPLCFVQMLFADLSAVLRGKDMRVVITYGSV